MATQRLVYAQPTESVLLPYMYMDIPIEYVKMYYMSRERSKRNLPLGIVYAKKDHYFAYGCTAMVTAYHTHTKKATILGLERFQKCFPLYDRVSVVRYIFDHKPQKGNLWVKQLRIIECLDMITKKHNVKIDMRGIKSIRTPEFSFTIATSQFFSLHDRYRLLATKKMEKRLDSELALLNARFIRKR